MDNWMDKVSAMSYDSCCALAGMLAADVTVMGIPALVTCTGRPTGGYPLISLSAGRGAALVSNPTGRPLIRACSSPVA